MTPEAGPLVSVIVPAWNAETTLGETLKSIAAQTYSNLEIIIVDDGSTDSTAAVAAEFCARDPRARMISTENAGVAAARNRAISESSGNWVAPIDADDLWHPTKIEKQVGVAFAAPEEPGFVYCWHRLIDDDSRVTGSGPRWALSGRAFNQLAYMNAVENGSALLIARRALLDVGGYDASLRARDAQGCEDVMLQLRIARRYPIAVVPEYLVGHRRHGRNMSGDFDRMVRSWRLVYRQVTGEGTLSRRLLRWVDGKCALDIAERRAVAGDYLNGLKHLGEAMMRDPVRCGSIVAYRMARSLRRRGSGPLPAPLLLHFRDVDPAADFNGDPHEIRAFSSGLDSLNRQRLQRLAEIDRALA